MNYKHSWKLTEQEQPLVVELLHKYCVPFKQSIETEVSCFWGVPDKKLYTISIELKKEPLDFIVNLINTRLKLERSYIKKSKNELTLHGQIINGVAHLDCSPLISKETKNTMEFTTVKIESDKSIMDILLDRFKSLTKKVKNLNRTEKIYCFDELPEKVQKSLLECPLWDANEIKSSKYKMKKVDNTTVLQKLED